MNDTATAASALLVDLAEVCATAGTADELLAGAVPLLGLLCGARATLVARAAGADLLPVAAAGVPLGLETLSAKGFPGRSADVPVPSSWASAAIARVSVRALPGDAGLLVLAWGKGEPAAAGQLEAALAIVDGHLARLHAEDALAHLTGRVDAAQRLANMGDYDWHIATDTNTWSDQLYRIYGHEPQSFNASYERFLSHIHPDDRDRVIAIHREAYATGMPFEMIERIVRADGQVRYLSSSGQVARGAGGEPARVSGTCIDVTEKVLAEQDRERVAARFRGLVESCPDAILVLDRERRVVLANGQAISLLGGDPVAGRAGTTWTWSCSQGQAARTTGLDGRPLRLDVRMAALSDTDGEDGRDDEGLVAVFFHDATPRLAGEAQAATLREAQVRRQQAMEMNDDVVQGLTAAALSMRLADTDASARYLEKTLVAARQMMNDWLEPLNGERFQPGDLVRSVPSTLDADDLGTSAMPDDRYRVLVVDDNDDVRRLLREQVAAIGKYAVVGEAADGNEAVQAAAELQPHVVLLDLSMPRMDGLQALPLILAAVKGVRVIVMSGFDKKRLGDEVIAAGAVRYLEKGLRMDLPGAIEDALKSA